MKFIPCRTLQKVNLSYMCTTPSKTVQTGSHKNRERVSKRTRASEFLVWHLADPQLATLWNCTYKIKNLHLCEENETLVLLYLPLCFLNNNTGSCTRHSISQMHFSFLSAQTWFIIGWFLPLAKEMAAVLICSLHAWLSITDAII